MQSIFVTGIGTGIGKTVISAILTEALDAAYWKPVQAGFENGTDSELVAQWVTPDARIFPETYRLRLAASPHIAAREEGVQIDLHRIADDHRQIQQQSSPHEFLIIEGAGGLMVPLNEKEFVIDLIPKLLADVVLVSRNYLGSINHSLLTAAACRSAHLPVLGWIFNDQYLHYEGEIEGWSGYASIASIPLNAVANAGFVRSEAARLKPFLRDRLRALQTV